MTDTTNITDISGGSNQTPLTIAQPPLSCLLCNIDLDGLHTWRVHVKSDEHVYNLQLKVSQPGSATLLKPRLSSQSTHRKAAGSSRTRTDTEHFVSADKKAQSDSETEDPTPVPEFYPGNCLFCTQSSSALDENMAHMAAAHNLCIPFPEFLAVDLEIVLSYLHILIFNYRECISCSTQRSTASAVQQHMASKGHCRFEITPETEEFYEIPQSQTQLQLQSQSESGNAVLDQMRRDSSLPVQLSSGKVITHRKKLGSNERRVARRVVPEHETDSFALGSEPSRPGLNPSISPATSRPRPNAATSPSPSPSLEITQRPRNNTSSEIAHRSEALLAAQLSKLHIAGNRAQQKEEKKRGRLDRGSNTLLFKHFRLDSGDSRFGKQF
ncbi:C2H2 type zinc-finger-domain-containing protein [Aspergillus crustosus]